MHREQHCTYSQGAYTAVEPSQYQQSGIAHHFMNYLIGLGSSPSAKKPIPLTSDGRLCEGCEDCHDEPVGKGTTRESFVSVPMITCLDTGHFQIHEERREKVSASLPDQFWQDFQPFGTASTTGAPLDYSPQDMEVYLFPIKDLKSAGCEEQEIDLISQSVKCFQLMDSFHDVSKQEDDISDSAQELFDIERAKVTDIRNGRKHILDEHITDQNFPRHLLLALSKLRPHDQSALSVTRASKESNSHDGDAQHAEQKFESIELLGVPHHHQTVGPTDRKAGSSSVDNAAPSEPGLTTVFTPRTQDIPDTPLLVKAELHKNNWAELPENSFNLPTLCQFVLPPKSPKYSPCSWIDDGEESMSTLNEDRTWKFMAFTFLCAPFDTDGGATASDDDSGQCSYYSLLSRNISGRNTETAVTLGYDDAWKHQ